MGEERTLRRLLAGLAVVLVTFGPGPALAKLVISPALVRADLDEGRPRGTFTLTNVGDQTERYRARAVHFELSETGALRLVEPGRWSLAPWIRFNPAEFELPPNASRVVRYTVLVPQGLEEGMYWGGIEFEPLQSSTFRFSDDKGKNLTLHVLTSALVPFFATKGDPEPRLVVSRIEGVLTPEGPGIVIRLENPSRTRIDVRGRYSLKTPDGEVVSSGDLPEVMILREGARLVGVRLKPAPEPGEYLVELDLELRQTESPIRSVYSVQFGS